MPPQRTCTGSFPATGCRPASCCRWPGRSAGLRRRRSSRTPWPGAASPKAASRSSCATGVRVTARRLLVATGLRDELPDVGGLRERWARDVLHCPYCHGYEVHGQQLGVLGGSPGSVRTPRSSGSGPTTSSSSSPAGTLTAEEREQLLARAIGIVEGNVAQVVVKDDRLHGVALDDGTLVRRDALFVPPRFVPNNDILLDLGCDLDENGWVRTDLSGQTTIPGSGPPATSATREPRSSPPRAKAPRPPSPSTPTSSTRTSATPSVTSAAGRPPEPTRIHSPPTRTHHQGAAPMSTTTAAKPVGPPTKHQLALMIWLAVFPTLTVLNLTLGDWLRPMSPILRTFVLATIAVPVVIYGLMPQLHKIRVRLLTQRANA